VTDMHDALLDTEAPTTSQLRGAMILSLRSQAALLAGISTLLATQIAGDD